ncbi:extracellular solute-binding protein [Antrihabitans sp. YC2-6]|uniref:extracellular solute-binding protein n=1 Tax=Antrihabitans sp. YC2-6 TaxID=2799498 RepID=UPI0018F5A0D7|nr:extracellular solute-binding protein [Antrihabitans sp. YC2-6]MBJ8348055.1 extracellular solute-binding protein [Antrihabitans sp. YC2-6]
MSTLTRARTVQQSTTSHLRATTVLRLYTSEPRYKIDEVIEAFTALNPDIDVDVFRAPTGELKSRIEVSSATGGISADVLMAADAETFEDYKARDLLLRYTPADVAALHGNLVDPDGYYVGTRIIPSVIAYNTGAYITPPRSWKVLSERRFSGQVAIVNPLISGAGMHNAKVWSETPSLGRSWLRDFSANRPRMVHSNVWVGELVAAGAQPLGIVADYVARDLAARGLPIAFEYPTDGAPYVTQPVGIFKDTPNAQAAKRFVDFLVSFEGQEIASAQHYIPVRRDVLPPAGFPRPVGIRLLAPKPTTTTRTKGALARTHASVA